MKIYERPTRRELSPVEAASILGVSERTFCRWRDRFEAEGADGLYDRRPGRVSGVGFRGGGLVRIARVLMDHMDVAV